MSNPAITCSCGFTTTTKSGMTLHQKKCLSKAQGEQIPVQPGTIGSHTPASEVLTSVDRNAFSKHIKARQEAMLKALTDQMNGNPDQVMDTLRREKGMTLSEEQLKSLIKGVEGQIDNTIEECLADEKEKIEVALSDLGEKYEEKQREMKERHRKEWHELAEAQKEQRKEFRDKLKKAKEKVVEEKAVDLNQKLRQYRGILEATKQMEAEVKAESVHRIALFNTSRKRLEHIIKDAANRAQEQLWMVGTRSEAAALVNGIPTVSEALQQCNSVDGFNSLMRKLDPNMALPAPVALSPIDCKTIDAKEVEEVEDPRDRRRRQQGETDHDRIYDEVAVGVGAGDDEEENE